MSRSYKHNPIYQDQIGKRFGKRYANKVVRRNFKDGKEIANGKSYRKLYESWNISDYCFRTTWQDYLMGYWYNEEDGLYYWNRWYGRNKEDGYTLKEIYNEWASVFLRK